MHPVRAAHAYTSCIHPVCALRVYSPCVQPMCAPHVCTPGMRPVRAPHAYSPCVQPTCAPCVCTPCVHPTHTPRVCTPCVQPMCSAHVCTFPQKMTCTFEPCCSVCLCPGAVISASGWGAWKWGSCCLGSRGVCRAGAPRGSGRASAPGPPAAGAPSVAPWLETQHRMTTVSHAVCASSSHKDTGHWIGVCPTPTSRTSSQPTISAKTLFHTNKVTVEVIGFGDTTHSGDQAF